MAEHFGALAYPPLQWKGKNALSVYCFTMSSCQVPVGLTDFNQISSLSIDFHKSLRY